MAFGFTSQLEQNTADVAPEGGVEYFPVPMEEWDEFVEAFCALEFVD